MKHLIHLIGGVLLGLVVGTGDVLLRTLGGQFGFFIQVIPALWIPRLVRHDHSFSMTAFFAALLLVDFFAATPFGVYTISYVAACYAVHTIVKKIFASRTVSVVGICIAMTVIFFRVSMVGILGILHLLRRFVLDIDYVNVRMWAVELVITAIVGVVFYYLSSVIRNRMVRHDKRSLGQAI